MTEDWRDETMNDRPPLGGGGGGEEAEGDRTNPGTVGPAAPQVVVVAMDFSVPARRAMAWAIEHALHVPSVLHTIHLVDPPVHHRDVLAQSPALLSERQ